jgi:hypothetical protein
MIGTTKPDMEEKMRGTPMWIANLPSLYYETLLSLERRSLLSFSPH